MNPYIKIVFFVLFPIVFSISLWGFKIKDVSWFDAIYTSLQLLTLNGSLDSIGSPLPWQINFARFALPIFTLSAIISLLYEKITKQLFFLRQAIAPHDTVFIGAGRTARAICRNLYIGKRILILDPNLAENQMLKLSKTHKISFLSGDGLDEKLIKKLYLNKSKVIYIFTGNDKQDLKIALLLAEFFLVQVKINKNEKLPRMIVDIDDQQLLKTVIHDARLKAYRKTGEIIWFSSQIQAARRVIWNNPVLKHSSQGRDFVHIGFIGFNLLQEQVLLQVLRTSVYLYCRKVIISIFDNNKKGFDEFIARNQFLIEPIELNNGNFINLAEIRFFNTNTNTAFPNQLGVALKQVSSECLLDILYVHDDCDFRTLSMVQRAIQTLVKLKIITRVVALIAGSELETSPEVDEFWKEIESETKLSKDFIQGKEIKSIYHEYVNVSLFHCKDELVVKGESYPGEKHAELGIQIHTAYMMSIETSKVSAEELKKKAKKEWIENLAKLFVWSNLFAADHLPIKIREIGFELDELIDEELFCKFKNHVRDNKELLSELEHRRYMYERLVDGWLFDATNFKAVQLNKTLIPFDELPNSEVRKDEKMVEEIVGLVEAYINYPH